MTDEEFKRYDELIEQMLAYHEAGEEKKAQECCRKANAMIDIDHERMLFVGHPKLKEADHD
jgi:restriction endonuclease Mrr